ncbi:hypothetical protein AAG906_007497 [Vitis piasezkii]
MVFPSRAYCSSTKECHLKAPPILLGSSSDLGPIRTDVAMGNLVEVSGSRVSLVLQSPMGKLIEQVIHLNFSTSNNEAEYKVVLAGLDLFLMLTTTKLAIRNDSQLINEHMTQYLTMVEKHLKKLDKIAATLPINGTIMLPIYLKVVLSITLMLVYNIGQIDSRWMFNIIKYLQTGDVLEDEKQAHKLCIQVARFTLINDQLYKRPFEGPYLKCLSKPEAKYVLAKLHEGDTESYVRRCNRCQRHAPISRVPSKALNPIISPWSFVQWGMDIVGPCPLEQHKKVLLIATNYFSKWVKGEAYVDIKDKDVSKFVWKNIVSDLEFHEQSPRPSCDAIFRIFCLDLNIKNLYSTPRYLQSNRLVEATNKTPLNALKKRLE